MGDRQRIDEIAQHVAEILKRLRLDAREDPELEETPQRVAEFYLDVFQAVDAPAPKLNFIERPSSAEELILVRDLPFYSLCVHHLVPFFGYGHIGYVPGTKIVGFNGLARVLRYFAGRPQLQERLTAQVADYLQRALQPRGLIVMLRARQFCLEMRGERLPGWIETTAAHGVLQTGPRRDEFFLRLRT